MQTEYLHTLHSIPLLKNEQSMLGTLFWTQPAAQFTVFPPAQLRIRAKCGGVHALKREWRTQGLINLQMWLVKLSQIDEKELKSFA